MIIKVIHFVLRKLMGGIMEKIISKIVEKIISNMSEQLRTEIKIWVKRLDEVAKATKNPWDDILVMLLKVALGIE